LDPRSVSWLVCCLPVVALSLFLGFGKILGLMSTFVLVTLVVALWLWADECTVGGGGGGP